MKSIILIIFVGITILSGCSSTVNEDIVRQQMELEKQRLEMEKERIKIAQEKRNEEIKAVPSWALSPPNADQTGFYAVGISQSEQLAFAIKKAKMQAEFELAKQYKQILSGSERLFEKEDNAGKLQSQTQVLIDKIVYEVPLVGYEVVKQEIKVIEDMHVSYILLKLPFDQFNKVLQQQKLDTTDITAKQAFAEFEARLQNRKQQELDRNVRLEQHAIELEVMRKANSSADVVLNTDSPE
ncbi:MAG: hypothetical protein ACSHWP_00210 [Pseudoalteromonas sp.]